MKKNISRIASMVLAVLFLFSTMPAFAADYTGIWYDSEGFQDYSGTLGETIAQNAEIPGVVSWTINEQSKFATASIVAEPDNQENYVINLQGAATTTARQSPGKGLVYASTIGSQNFEMGIKFRLARATEESKTMTLQLRSTSSSRLLVLRFDLVTGQVYCGNEAMATSPANSTVYFADYVNKAVPVGEWVDIEILLLPGDTKRMMIYADGKPLVYGAAATDGTISVDAGRPILPFAAPESSVWVNNSIVQMVFSVDSVLDSVTAANASSFYLDDIERTAFTEDEEDCSLTLIDRIAPVMDEYSTSIASPKIINTDMQLPVSGRNGATIEWASDNAAVVIDNGRVILPDAENITEAKLTAKVTQGEVSLSQSWTVKVAPRIMANVDSALVEEGLLKSVTVSKKCELPASGKVLVGVYNTETKLYSAFKLLTPAADSDVITLTENVSVGANDVVKAFVWNMDTLIPLAASFSK